MIRPYRSEDLSVLMIIGNLAWRGIYMMYREKYGEELFSFMVPEVDSVKGEQIKKHCAAHPDWVYVCEEDGRIVGFVTFLLDKEKYIGHINNNAVDPNCGLKGIGQQMYKAVFERFQSEGMRYAQVRTGLDCAHAPARRAYERAGFDIKVEDVTYFKKM